MKVMFIHIKALSFTAAFSTLLLLCPLVCVGHVMPDHADPSAGSTLSTPPERVRIWFDGPLEHGLCSITVRDSSGNQVDKGDSRVNPEDQTLLETGLEILHPGVYHIFWNAVTVGGHKTSGDLTFTIR